MKYRQINILKKILVPIIFVSSIAILLTLLTTLFLLGNQADYNLERDLEHAKRIIKDEFEEMEMSLMPETVFLASDPAIKEAVENRDIEALVKKMVPVKVTFKVDGINILDVRGIELAKVGETIPIQKAAAEAGLDLESVSFFIRDDNEIWLTSVAPVRSKEGGLVAIVLAGNKIDKTFIDTIKSKTGADIVVEYDSYLIGSSTTAVDVSIKHSRKEEGLKETGDLVIENSTLNNRPFAVNHIDIATTGGTRVTVYALKSTRSSDEVKKSNATAILLINLIAVLVLITATYVIGRSISKPLKLMSKRARMIANGDYMQRIDYAGIEEIDELATSFNLMSKALDENRKELEKRANTDSLTDLFNHRYFQDALTHELSRSERYGHPLSLVVIDIDNFKKINDTFGHKKGDLALKSLANSMANSVREFDIPCRIGGEEFAIILPETPPSEALAVAERLRMDIISTPVEDIGQITVSLGVASFPEHADDKDSLIDSADIAMYKAKRRGKNQALLYNASETRAIG